MIAMLKMRVAIKRQQISVQNKRPWCLRRLIGLAGESVKSVEDVERGVDMAPPIGLYFAKRSTIVERTWRWISRLDSGCYNKTYW